MFKKVNKIFIIIFSIISTFCLLCCSENKEKDSATSLKRNKTLKSSSKTKINTISYDRSNDYSLLDTSNSNSLDENQFNKKQNLQIKLLKEIEFIADDDVVDLNHFWFFPLNETMKLSNGFILIIKAGVNGSPVRKTYIYKRIKSELKLLNLFNGYLVQRSASTVGGYDDLLIHFGNQKFPVERDGGKFLFDCLFQWNGKNYSFLHCEKINNSKIKPIYMDSIAKDTYYFLRSRKYF